MNPTFELGRIGGIRVAVHWSVLVIWWLLAWSLASQLLPDEAPGYGDGVYWAVGLASATVFLAGLLAHEISHALVARRHDVPTEVIVLWLFGGVAQMANESPDPRTEFRVAVIGPVTSIGLGILAATAAATLDGVGAPRLVVVAMMWLALINVVIGIFNLVPAFPLDGGRVLRAALWHRSGDRGSATARAVRIGKAFAYALIALGVLDFTAGYAVGLWYVFIGWFLLMAASAEAERVGVGPILDRTRAHEVMSPDPDTAPASISVQSLLDEYVLVHRHSTFPLVDRSGQLLGVVTLRDIKRVPPDRRPDIAAEEIMIPLAKLAVVSPDQPFTEMLRSMTRDGRGRALVMEDGRLVGIVTPTDVSRVLELAELAGRG